MFGQIGYDEQVDVAVEVEITSRDRTVKKNACVRKILAQTRGVGSGLREPGREFDRSFGREKHTPENSDQERRTTAEEDTCQETLTEMNAPKSEGKEGDKPLPEHQCQGEGEHQRRLSKCRAKVSETQRMAATGFSSTGP